MRKRSGFVSFVEKFSDMQPFVTRYWPILLLLPLVFATLILLNEGVRNVPTWLIVLSLVCAGISVIATRTKKDRAYIKNDRA